MVKVEEESLGGVAASWWGWSGEVELDLGCARGRFLVEVARRYRECFFGGVERQSDRAGRTAKKIGRLGLGNAGVVRAGIMEFLRGEVPAGRIGRVHVLFPDPWPKRRHAERRLVREEFLEEMERILRRGGELRFLTDQEAYFREVRERMVGRQGWEIAGDGRWAPDGEEWPATEFQARFLAAGQPVYGLVVGWSGGVVGGSAGSENSRRCS